MNALIVLQIQVSLAVLLVLLLRCCMTRLPKRWSYTLWIIVFLRLLIPVSLESPLGLLPGAEGLGHIWQQMAGGEVQNQPDQAEGKLSADAGRTDLAEGQQASADGKEKEIQDGMTTPSGSGAASGEPRGLRNTSDSEGAVFFGLFQGVESLTDGQYRYSGLSIILLAVWLTGFASVLGYNFHVMSRIRRQTQGAERLEGEVYLCSGIETPFTMGILRPRIYLPTMLEPEKRAYILCHERVHIRRRDYLVKWIAFLLTAIYWYNPLIWLAFCMLEQDMEMSCDEAVVRSMGDGVRRRYSQSLLDFAAGRQNMAVMPPAFGEHGVKQRVKNILTGKRNKWRGALAGILILAAVALLVFTTSGSSAKEPPTDLPGAPSPSPEYGDDSDAVKEAVMGKSFVFTGKTFVYTGESSTKIDVDVFSISISEDGTFSYSESIISSHLGFGSWEIKDDILVLKDDEQSGRTIENRFRIDGEELVFVEEGSSNFPYVKLQDGERFAVAGDPDMPDYKPGDQIEELSWECYEQIYDGDGIFYLNTRYGIYRKEKGPEGDVYTCLYPRYIGAPQPHYLYPRLTLHPNLDRLYFVTDSEYTEESLDWWDNCIMSLDLRTLETEIVEQDEGSNPQLWFDRIDAFYGIGYSEKEKSQEWEEMAADWGDDLLGQYELVRSLEMDVADSPGDETIEVYALREDSELAGMYGGVVRVLDARGELLLTETANLPMMGHNALYVGSLDGQNFLMNFYLEDRGTYGTYQYEVYRLTQDGGIQQTAGSRFDWDYDESLGEKALLYNDKVFREWAEELQKYMEAGQLLMSTLEWELETDPTVRPYRYNYDTLTRGHMGEGLKGRE